MSPKDYRFIMPLHFRQLAKPLPWYLLFVAIYIYTFRAALLSASTYTALNFELPPGNPAPTLASLAASLFQSWSPNLLGYPAFDLNLQYYWSPLLMVFSFNNQLLAEKLLGLHTFLAFFAMDFLISSHFTKSRPARFIGSLVYALNPITVNLSASLWGYAFLPFAVHFGFKILFEETNRIRNAVLLGLFSALSVSSYYYYQTLIPAVVTICFLTLTFLTRDVKRTLERVSLLLLSATTFAVLMLPYLIQNFVVFYQEYALPSASQITIWYQGWSILSMFVLFPTSIGLATETFLVGMVLVLLVILPLLRLRDVHDLKSRTAVISLSIFLVLMVLYYTNAQGLTPAFEFFNRYFSPFITPLLNPAGSMVTVTFAYSCLLAISVDLILKSKFASAVGSRLGRRREILAVVLLFLLVPSYVLAYPILNAPAMTYPNPSSMTSIYDFLQQHDDNGSYRYYVLPLDTQTEENTYSFPNLFAAQEPALPASLEYGRFIDYVLVNNLTNHLGSLLSGGNVKYVFVDKVQQNWIPPDQASYSGRYGAPRIVGYSWGVWGAWEGFAQLLNKQVDLKLIANESNFMAYENMAFVPKLQVYQNATLVVGDMRALLPMVDNLGFNTSDNLVTYADQNMGQTDATLLKSSSTVVFYDSTIDDLVLDTVANQFDLSPSDLRCPNCTQTEIYLPLEDPLYFSFFGFTENSGYISMSGGSNMQITFDANQSGNYQVWARSFLSPNAGTLVLPISGSARSVSLASIGNLGFKWVELGTLNATKGVNTLVLTDEAYPSYLDRIAVVPSQTMSSTMNSISNILQGKRTISMFDSMSNEFNAQSVRVPIESMAIQSLQGWDAFPNQTATLSVPMPGLNGAVTVSGPLDRVCSSCGDGQIGAERTFVNAESWNQYDYLGFSVKTTEPSLYVVLLNSSGAVTTNQRFEISPGAWNSVHLPLVNASYASIRAIEFIGVGDAPGVPGQMTIANMSLGESLSVLSLSPSWGSQANYSVYFTTRGNGGSAPIRVEIGGHRFNVTSIGNGAYGPVSTSPNLKGISLTFFGSSEPTLVVLSNGNGLPFMASQSNVASGIRVITDPASTLKYVVTSSSNESKFVYLGEGYGVDWVATYGSSALAHFIAYGFANGYVVSANNTNHVSLSNQFQGSKNLLVLSNLLPLAAVVAYLAYDFGKLRRRRFA